MDGNLQKNLKKYYKQIYFHLVFIHWIGRLCVCRANSNSYKKITAYEAITIPLRICEQIF